MFCRMKAFIQEDNQYFSACEANIASRNHEMLRKGSIVYAFVLCFYTLFTILTHQPQLLQTMYYVFDAIHLCLCAAVFVSDKLKKRRFRTTQIYCACLEISVLSFFALEGVFTARTQHSLYIPIAILLVLLLFIHGAVYAYTITGLYVLTFAVLSCAYKTPEAYTNDLYIAIASLISANIGYFLIAQMRHREGSALMKYEKLSQTDLLTGVYNKAAILEIGRRILAKPGSAGAFIMIDLDNFKAINDRCGHDVGDEVLRSVARTMEANFRETDFVGRFGGDEFIVLMDGCKDAEIVKSRVGKLLADIRNLRFSKEGLDTQASAGITLKHEGDTSSTIFKRADTALYQAKSDGKGYYRIIE